MTRAKITFDFLPSKNKNSSSTKVVIKGKKEEVDAAMDLIDELVAEVELTSNKSVHVAGRALPNNLSVHALNSVSMEIANSFSLYYQYFSSKILFTF